MSITRIHLEDRRTTELFCTSPRPSADGALWLDFSQPTEDDLAWLERTYQFHPLTIEDCRHFNQRAKVEAYEGYLFLSLTTSFRTDGDVDAQEMEAFLGPDYIITVHREPMGALDDVRAHITSDTRADFILYLIADHMADRYFPLLDEIEDEIDTLEDQILENATQETLHRIFTLKQHLVFLRKIAAPMRDVMNALAGTRYGLIDTRTALYFRDVFDHLARIYDLVETSRDLLGNALDAYLSTVSNRLNDIMKRLTLFTTIFMPISFLVGFGGMNFQHLPFDNVIALSIMLALIVLIPTGMLVYYRRSGWL